MKATQLIDATEKTSTGLTLGSAVEVRDGDETIIGFGEVEGIDDQGDGEVYLTIRTPDGAVEEFHESLVYGLN